MAFAYVLADDSVISRLECAEDDVKIVSASDFGGGLWFLGVESPKIPAGSSLTLEIVTWDTCGRVPARFKPWAEL